jgi:hypothetical protein
VRAAELKETEKMLAVHREIEWPPHSAAEEVAELDELERTMNLERERQRAWSAKSRAYFEELDIETGDLIEYADQGHPLTGLLHVQALFEHADDSGLWAERIIPMALQEPDDLIPAILRGDPVYVAWADMLDVRVARRQSPVIRAWEYEQQREQQRREAATRAEFEAQVEREVVRRAVLEEAKRRARGVREEALPEGLALDAFLNTDLAEDTYIIENLLPTGGNALLAAAAKSGKSTMVHNLIRSFVDGDTFLGEFGVNQFRNVGLLDFELSAKMIQSWLAEHEIEHAERVKVFPMRGRTGTFDILDPQVRSKWAEALRGVDVLILDPLLPVLAALGLDHNSEVAPFLDAFDALKSEAGISEGIIVHHYGHGAQRATGDSRLLGWPDALWDVSWDDPEDFGSLRLFHARGRDVDVPRTPLKLDGRRLSLDGTVSTVRQDIRLEKVLDFLRANPESDRDTILAAGLKGVNTSTFHSVTREAIEGGRITAQTVGKGRKLYSAGARKD